MNEEFNVVIAEDEKRICSLIKALLIGMDYIYV